MSGYTILFLSFFALTCRGTNTTFKWSSATRIATSSTHGNIGDYVAAGLGISAHETSSALAASTSDGDNPAAGPGAFTDKISTALAITASDNSTQIGDAKSPSETQYDSTAIPTTAAPVSGASEHITDATNATSTTQDCWQDWLDYWSASSLNKVTYETSIYNPRTETKTELRVEQTEIPTSSWQSDVGTFTLSTPITSYSDGYPVSVSFSKETHSYSDVGWTVVTIWSSLYEYHTTFTETYNFYDRITTTQSTTALPTPSCELPSDVAGCQEQWVSYIHEDTWRYWNDFDNPTTSYFEGTPDCTQAMVTGDLCTSMASFYFARETMYGQADDVGWRTSGTTSYFPASQSLAPGCSLGCQACSITGETVQLLYWPPETATLVENGTETATLTPFAQNNTGPRTASFDGTILTSPTVYISYDVLHAANSCGAVGNTYRNTILPLTNTNHLFSLDPVILYHGYGQGYRTSSFNLDDLIEPIETSVYDRQSRCLVSSISWINAGGWQNGAFSCARTEPYAPIIGVPPEARALDPEWASCEGWYGGLFDPPMALQPADAIALPTLPSVATSPAATPQPTVDSGLPKETSAPATTSPKVQKTQDQSAADPTHGSPGKESNKQTKDSNPTPGAKETAEGSEDGVGPTHVSSEETSDDQNKDSSLAPSGEETTAKSGDGNVGPDTSDTDADSQPGSHKGVQAFVSIIQVIQASEAAGDPPIATPASDLDSHADHGVVFSAGSDVHTAVSSQGHMIIDGTPVSGGHATVIADQAISVEPGRVFINGVPHENSVLERPSSPHGIFTVADKQHTAIRQANGAVEIDGESYTIGAVAAIDGSTITVASDGVKAGATAIPYADSPLQSNQAAVFAVNGHTYNVDTPSGSLLINGIPASAGDKITTNGDVLTVGSHAINVAGTAIPLTGGQSVKPTATAGTGTIAEITISGESMNAVKDGDGVLIDGTKITLGQVTTISGTQISIASEGIVVGSSTAAFHRLVSSTAGTGDAVTFDGTVYSASALGDSNAVLLAGQTLSPGGPAITIDGQVITKGANGISILNPTAVASATAQSGSVIIIDGTAYTAIPVSGSSGVVVLDGHTLSIGGPGVTIADHLVTKGSDGVLVSDTTSLASDGTSGQTMSSKGVEGDSAANSTSRSTSDSNSRQTKSSTDVVESSTGQQSPATPSEESSASRLSHGYGVLLGFMILLTISLSS